MSEDEVKCMRKVVDDSANLRDQSLFAMLVSGLESHRFLGANPISEMSILRATLNLRQRTQEPT